MRRVTFRHAVLGFVLISSCFFLADLINVYVSHALLQVTPPEPPTDRAAASLGAQASSSDTTQMVKAILTSGVFVVPANVLALDPKTQQATPPPQPLDFAGKLKLLGTALGNSAKTYAAIEFEADKKQRLYALNEDIEGFGQLVEIRREAIRIRQGTREGEVPLFMPPASPMPVLPVNTSTAPVLPVIVPTALKGNHIVIDRRMLETSFSDWPKLMNDAKAVPYYNTAGKMAGWHFLQFRPESVFTRLGLIPGDVLLQVNGMKVEDPTRMLTFFQQAKDERTIKLDIIRQSEPVKITYDIR